MRLECVAEGNPIPSLFWEFNGSRLVNDSIGTISRAELSSAGRYSCVAENLVSESRQSTNLFVIGKISTISDFVSTCLFYRPTVVCERSENGYNKGRRSDDSTM